MAKAKRSDKSRDNKKAKKKQEKGKGKTYDDDSSDDGDDVHGCRGCCSWSWRRLQGDVAAVMPLRNNSDQRWRPGLVSWG